METLLLVAVHAVDRVVNVEEGDSVKILVAEMAVEAGGMVLGLLHIDHLVIDGEVTVGTLGKGLLKIFNKEVDV